MNNQPTSNEFGIIRMDASELTTYVRELHLEKYEALVYTEACGIQYLVYFADGCSKVIAKNELQTVLRLHDISTVLYNPYGLNVEELKTYLFCSVIEGDVKVLPKPKNMFRKLEANELLILNKQYFSFFCASTFNLSCVIGDFDGVLLTGDNFKSYCKNSGINTVYVNTKHVTTQEICELVNGDTSTKPSTYTVEYCDADSDIYNHLEGDQIYIHEIALGKHVIISTSKGTWLDYYPIYLPNYLTSWAVRKILLDPSINLDDLYAIIPQHSTKLLNTIEFEWKGVIFTKDVHRQGTAILDKRELYITDWSSKDSILVHTYSRTVHSVNISSLVNRILKSRTKKVWVASHIGLEMMADRLSK